MEQQSWKSSNKASIPSAAARNCKDFANEQTACTQASRFGSIAKHMHVENLQALIDASGAACVAHVASVARRLPSICRASRTRNLQRLTRQAGAWCSPPAAVEGQGLRRPRHAKKHNRTVGCAGTESAAVQVAPGHLEVHGRHGIRVVGQANGREAFAWTVLPGLPSNPVLLSPSWDRKCLRMACGKQFGSWSRAQSCHNLTSRTWQLDIAMLCML